MKFFLISLYFLLLLGLLGCDIGPDSPQGFSLPQGDHLQGKKVFIKYQCLTCHSIESTVQENIKKHPSLAIPLGGKSHRVTTYAELLTSVINPSHKFPAGYEIDTIGVDGKSKMPIFNDVMTVTELVDLVTFLQSHYEFIPDTPSNYRIYKY
jgi:L-cysteine S-thiosulfotransferase